MRGLGRNLAIAGAFLGVASLALAAGYQGGTVSNGGTVSGVVKTTKKPPEKKAVQISKDPSVCGKKPIYDESLIIGKKGELANAVVWIDGIASGKKLEPTTAVVDQIGCVYTPHVQAVAVGSAIELRSQDAVLHNVHGFLDEDTVFNIALPNKGSKSKQKAEDAGIIKLKCDAGHVWMSAYVAAFDHPYFAVTGADGSFKIGDVPAGKYKVMVWHETLGQTSGTVDVSAGGTATLELSLK